MEAANKRQVAKKPTATKAHTRAKTTDKRPPLNRSAEAQTQAPVLRQSVAEAADGQHQRMPSESLKQSLAIHYEPPQYPKRADAKKSGKASKTKRVRDSFTMPEKEYARIGILKKRLGGAYRKSDLLRAGLAVLYALDDAELRTVMAHVEHIETVHIVRKQGLSNI